MIVFDTETTGLLQPSSAPLDQQPEIIEFAAVRLKDDDLEQIEELSLLIRPTLLWPLPEEVTKMNGITNEQLESAGSFARVLPQITDFVLGERVWVAHNVSFDVGVLGCELQRLGRVTQFPWAPVQLCTVELTTDLSGRRLRLGELYKLATGGQEQQQAHRALADVQTLVTCVRWLRGQGRI